MKPIHLFALLPAAFAVAPAAYSAPPAVTAPNSGLAAAYDHAIALARSGNLDGAIAACRQILAKAPTAAPVWATMARLLSQQGHNADAVTAANKAVALAPKNAAFQADLADFYLRGNDRVKAESWAQSALKTAPKSDVALSVLSTLRLTKRDYKAALPYLTRLQAVRGGKDRAVAQNIVVAYFNLKDKANALKAAQAYSQAAPTDADAMLGVIDLAISLKNATVATAYINKVAKIAPKSPLPAYYRGRVGMMDDKVPIEKRFAAAEPNYQKAVNMAPTEPTFLIQLALAQLGQGDRSKWGAARSNMTAAILYDNHSKEARYGLGKLDEEEEMWDDAAVQYSAYLQIDPNNNEVRRTYAGVLIKADRRPDAYDQFRLLSQRLPEDTYYLKELGSYLLYDKNYAGARAVYTDILERDPKDADAPLNIAQTYMGENNARAARVAFDKAIEANPKRESPYLLLAQLYINNGEKDAGMETLERALKANPNANLARWQLIELYIAAKRDDDAWREIPKLTLKDAGENRNDYRLVGGNLYMAREKYSEAIEEFERIAKEEPDNPAVLIALATAYDRGGRAADAATTYERTAIAAEKLLLMPQHRKNESLRDALTKARTGQKQPERATEFLKNIDATQ